MHARDYSEDHISHLIWGFMAIYHVNLLYPELNDMPNLEALRSSECGDLYYSLEMNQTPDPRHITTKGSQNEKEKAMKKEKEKEKEKEHETAENFERLRKKMVAQIEGAHQDSRKA